jgi:hypothetical protein
MNLAGVHVYWIHCDPDTPILPPISPVENVLRDSHARLIFLPETYHIPKGSSSSQNTDSNMRPLGTEC